VCVCVCVCVYVCNNIFKHLQHLNVCMSLVCLFVCLFVCFDVCLFQHVCTCVTYVYVDACYTCTLLPFEFPSFHLAASVHSTAHLGIGLAIEK